MADIHVWYKDAAGNYAGELYAPNASQDLATITANAAAIGRTVVDATAAGAKRPPDAVMPADPLKSTYSTAVTTDAKVDVIAQRLGLK